MKIFSGMTEKKIATYRRKHMYGAIRKIEYVGLANTVYHFSS